MREDPDIKTYGPIWPRLSSTLGSDASGGEGVLPNYIRTLLPGQRLVARAEVAQIVYNDNGSIREILDQGEPRHGTVLVVAGARESTTSVTGGVTVLELLALGFVGMVTDGPVRDSDEIRQSGFKIWCRGTTPIASAKKIRLPRPREVILGGLPIHDGDVVMADDDGITIWAAESVPDLVTKAFDKDASDSDRLRSLSR